jgi:hypothetical protein
MSGTALLAFIALCFQGLPQVWFEMMEGMWRWLIIAKPGNTRERSSPRSYATRRGTKVASARDWSSPRGYPARRPTQVASAWRS